MASPPSAASQRPDQQCPADLASSRRHALLSSVVLATVTQDAAGELLAGGDRDAVALVEGSQVVSYEELGRRVDARLAELGLARRSVVVLTARNSVEFVSTYLALLKGGHVPLLAGSHAEQLAGAWHVDAIVHVDASGVRVETAGTDHRRDVHPDLALLLSTSGSTGAPKLVRLSHENLLSNARAIATYLQLTASDRGITSLPLHYCYGLSVLHSHLVVGGAVVLTEASVIDPCFAAAMRDRAVTNVAGVPHTFELLQRAGPELIHTESLRFVTQAGGRLAPDRVSAWLERTARWGAEFYVMYGQTEATARIAYLPPDLAARRPGAIGRPIPGGQLEVRPVAGMPEGVGELVYRGPNVMLGYATTPHDLSLGATLTELATGDVGRFHADDGVFEIVGRTSRFVKPFGLRVDLDAVEAELARAGIEAAVAGDDHRLAVCAPAAAPDAVRRTIATFTGLPPGLIGVEAPTAIPRTAAGKVDYDAVLRSITGRPLDDRIGDGGDESSVATIFGSVLGRSDVTSSSTFVSLGGDSLNYVECSVRLERLLGHLPADWHLTPVMELAATVRPRRRSRLDTTVLLRAIGICAVVATHMKLFYFPGGSHLMLAVVGYNLSRFQLPITAAGDRARAALRTVTRAALPTVAWVGVGMLLVGGYSIGTLTLINNYVGPEAHLEGRWHYWFIEAFVQLTLITTVLLAVPSVRRFERRASYAFPLLLLAATLVFRYHWLEIEGLRNLRFRTHGVAWFFALGWLAHQSTTRPKQLLTTALCLLTIPGFFHRPEREWFIALGIVTLIWLRAIPLPRAAPRVIAALAAASMWIYISHFRVWPPLDRNLPAGIAYVLTIVAGIAIWRTHETAAQLARHATNVLRNHRPRQRHPAIAVATD